MKRDKIEVNLYSSWLLDNGYAPFFWIRGYSIPSTSRIGITDLEFLNHELLGLLFQKYKITEVEEECYHPHCFASCGYMDGLCERHRELVKLLPHPLSLYLDVYLFGNDDIRKIENILKEKVDCFSKNTSVSLSSFTITKMKKKIENGEWLAIINGEEKFFPPYFSIDDILKYNPERTYRFVKVPLNIRRKMREETIKYAETFWSKNY